MAKRVVRGLMWARQLPGRPGCIRQGRARGVKAFGTRYEKALAKAISLRFERGVWYQFEDADGEAYCQVDFRGALANEGLIVLEVKYTWTEAARIELEKLYVPVVERAARKRTWGIVVCNKLVPGIKEKVCGELEEAIEWTMKGFRATWQWLPKTPGPRFDGM